MQGKPWSVPVKFCLWPIIPRPGLGLGFQGRDWHCCSLGCSRLLRSIGSLGLRSKIKVSMALMQSHMACPLLNFCTCSAERLGFRWLPLVVNLPRLALRYMVPSSTACCSFNARKVDEQAHSVAGISRRFHAKLLHCLPQHQQRIDDLRPMRATQRN